MRHNERYGTPEIVGSWFAQARGYLATIDAFVGLGIIKNRRRFVTKKLAAPQVSKPAPIGTEMLDTLAECWWGLWLHEKFGGLQEGRLLPSGARDADFWVSSEDGELWVDCISLTPEDDEPDLSAYFSRVVRNKWRKKFGHHQDQALTAVLAVTVLKNQECIVPFLRHHEDVVTQWPPEPSLWSRCPSLTRVWFGSPPWHERPQIPEILGIWERPIMQ